MGKDWGQKSQFSEKSEIWPFLPDFAHFALLQWTIGPEKYPKTRTKCVRFPCISRFAHSYPIHHLDSGQRPASSPFRALPPCLVDWPSSRPAPSCLTTPFPAPLRYSTPFGSIQPNRTVYPRLYPLSIPLDMSVSLPRGTFPSFYPFWVYRSR